MNVSDIIRTYEVDEPSDEDVSELSNALGCSESDAAKLIQSVDVLRTMYEDECSVQGAEQHHRFSKKTIKEYIETRLDVADSLVPYFNGDPRGPAVKVMQQPDDGEINPHKPWEYAPDYWPFVIAMSEEAFIPDVR